MKVTPQAQKWLSAGLAVVCVVLVLNLVLRSGRVRATASRPPAPTGAAGDEQGQAASSARKEAALSSEGVELRLEEWKALQARPLPRLARNPFEVERPAAGPSVAATPQALANQPPPPPPIPLKPLGHSLNLKGVEEAFVTDDDQVYVVHEGEVFAGKYRVLRITPSFVEVQDETSRQTIQLPYPQ